MKKSEFKDLNITNKMEEFRMTQEEIMKMMQNPEVREAVSTFFMGNMQKQKFEKIKNYNLLNHDVKKGQILFVGSSLMENFPINELQQTLVKPCIIYNRGVGGSVIAELLDSMEECIFELEPSKLFINIGTNDIASPDYKKEKLIVNYDNILTQIRNC